MSFNSIPFLLFFLWLFISFHFVAVRRAQRLWLIVAANVAFYGSWGAHALPVFAAATAFTYFMGRAIHGQPDAKRKKALLAVGVVVLLADLIYFKYTNFLLQQFVGGRAIVNVVAPIGVSYFTFMGVGYLVEVYRGAPSSKNPLEFSSWFTFFPAILAGPIMRNEHRLQFKQLPSISWSGCERALLLIAAGMANRTLGNLLGSVADPFFAKPSHALLESWIGPVAFAGQMYADFAGYTEIVTGVALLLGFSVPQNFNFPYISRSPVEFWQRWHISLSTWLRDYLWLPLLMKWPRHAFVNLMITMTLCGLWHGATWSLVIWGAYQGLLIVTTHVLTKLFPVLEEKLKARFGAVSIIGMIVTNYLIVIGRVISRSKDLAQARGILHDMHWPSEAPTWSYPVTLNLVLVLCGFFVGHGISWLGQAHRVLGGKPILLWTTAAVLLMLSMTLGSNSLPLYAQF